MNESRKQEQAARGDRCAALRQELEETFADLERECFETFRRSDVHDASGHRACRMYLRVLDDLRDRLTHKIVTGEASKKELLTMRESRLKRVFNG